MNLWVDADACPVAIKDILFRAARRTKVPLTLVANQFLQVPSSEYIRFVQVPQGFDVADNKIVQQLVAGDLVITSDIPLAAEVIANDGIVLSPRGELFTEDNISARLATRDLLDSLRSSGYETGGPAAMSPRDRQAFASHLDKILAARPL
ncbi:MAG: YaiI/YqxD family protein [Burkholderiaceae bacterium]